MQTHLHTRSCYTLLNSTLRINDIVMLAKKEKLTSIALCDRNVMSGAMAFYRACREHEIKPIFALEFTCVIEEKKVILHAYAVNDIGYKQLLKLSTYLCTKKDTITLFELMEKDKGLIITTTGQDDDLQSLLLQENGNALSELLLLFKTSFQEFYVAIAMNDSPLLKRKNEQLKLTCAKVGVKTFAMSNIYYAEATDEIAYKAVCAIEQQKTLEDPTLTFSAKRYFRTISEMEELYTQEDLEVSDMIADKCNVKMDFEKASLPVFKNKFDVDSKVYLRNLCQEGLKRRLHNKVSKQYVERLQYELDVITRMEFQDYFLIVYDFIRYAKSKGIYVGPGRGSAAGSLVAYSLGITQVDPIQYGLIFERFLNPERISMPDIDIDFPDDRRDEVLTYVRELYGDEHVAHITTFGTLAAKQVLRDVGRVLRVSLNDVDMLSKMVPNVLKITLRATYEQVPRFKQTIQSSKQFQQLFKIALKLEGLPRHMSTHAAGIVLANKDIEEVCPLVKVEADMNSTQFTMEYLEGLGLIKIDFLGLRNLTIIDEICRHVQATGVSFDISKIPLDDKKVFQMLQAVDTVGIFQLESEGMRALIRKMQVKNFEEIVAAIALFRPGPMENIPLYLENRSHPDKINYMSDALKPILVNTYGVMIYQEQIMQATQIMANFSLAKADILRKAMSKKIPEELAKLQQDFIDGAVANGYDKALATSIYEQIQKFAGYGFNRSHSVAYGLISYQLAYLKANYPLSFFASLLNSVIGAERKSSEYIFEAKRRNIPVLRPSVNKSYNEYVIEGNALRYPLVGIKNVGIAMSTQLLHERELHGPFENYFDFVARISLLRITSKAIESLIDAGALDDFNETRATLKHGLDDAIRYASLVKVNNGEEEQLDFGIVSKPVLIKYADNAYEKSNAEKQMLGFYLSEHPITKLRDSMNKKIDSIAHIQTLKGYVSIVGVIERTKQHRTKKGDLMMFVVVSDETSSIDIVCMPNIYKEKQDILVRGNYVYVEGTIDDRQSCLVKKINKLDIEVINEPRDAK